VLTVTSAHSALIWRHMKNREEGYYWALHRGHWVITEYTGDDDWCLMDCTGYCEEEDFIEIGAKIESPVPKHVCNYQKCKHPELGDVVFNYCSCGLAWMNDGLSSEKQVTLSRLLKTPGAVFEVVEGEL